MTRARLLLGALGLAAGVFGLLRLLQLGWDRLPGVLLFLAGGVVVHDAVVAPLTIAATVIGTRLLPPRLRRRVTVGLVVLLTVTAATVPTLLRRGTKPDNPTLLPRDYTVGWLVVAAVVLASTLLLPPLWRRLSPRAR